MNVNFELSPAARTAAQGRYAEHILNSTANGKIQLEKGNETPFTGWDYRAVSRLLQISLDLTKDSLQDFNDGVVGPLRNLVEKIRRGGDVIDIAFAGEGTLQGHSTYFRADFNNAPVGSLEITTNNLGTDPNMGKLLNALYGEKVTLNAFVPGVTSYGCTDKPSDLIVAGREYAALKTHEYAPVNSGVVVPTYNLLHFVAGIGGVISPEAGRRLAEEGHEISERLKNHPVNLQVGRVLFARASVHIGISNEKLLKTA